MSFESIGQENPSITYLVKEMEVNGVGNIVLNPHCGEEAVMQCKEFADSAVAQVDLRNCSVSPKGLTALAPPSGSPSSSCDCVWELMVTLTGSTWAIKDALTTLGFPREKGDVWYHRGGPMKLSDARLAGLKVFCRAPSAKNIECSAAKAVFDGS